MSGLNNKQTFVLDFDDFSMTLPGFETLQRIKEHFPNFKCTLFTPAFNIKLFTKEIKVERFKWWGKLIAANGEWIEIAPHGFSHLKGEMVCDRKQAEIIIPAIENLFGKVGVEFVKVFKAPYWEISKEAEEVLREKGYTLAIDRNNPIVHTDIPTYVFNWSIEEPIPTYHMVKGHGHVHGTINGLERCMANLLKIPIKAEFKFVSQYLNEGKNFRQEPR